jgi:hypothetical protein
MKAGKRQSQRHQKLKPRTHDEERRETAEVHSHSPISVRIRTVVLAADYSPLI